MMGIQNPIVYNWRPVLLDKAKATILCIKLSENDTVSQGIADCELRLL